MARYKVPQDVEADDKLIGPFTFRQFIYLIIVAMAIAIAWGLGQLFLPLAIIPLPIIIFFSAIALPLRKDQPMEIYMAAMWSFLIKPHKRKWDPDGIESLIEITVPKTIEVDRVKDITQNEAQRRLGYLAEVVDSKGWSVRGGAQMPNNAMNSDFYYDAQQAEDIFGEDTHITQILDEKLDQSNANRLQEIKEMMAQKTAAANENSEQTADTASTDNEAALDDTEITFNPYPSEMRQSILPSKKDDETAPSTSVNHPSADIINLANNTDLSIATIAHQANRINEKLNANKEIYIALR